MPISIRNVSLALYVTTLVACGGGGSSSQSVSTSQQSPSSSIQTYEQVSQNDISREEALAAVSDQARNKITPDFLGRIFNQTPSYVIVDFVSNDLPTDSLETKKAAYASIKEKVSLVLSPDYSVITEYDCLPISYALVRSRRALVSLLNNDNVKSVHENVTIELNDPVEKTGFLTASLRL